MDLRHLQYFSEIVKSDFNLSKASKNLHLSQPALSQIIKNFEVEENVLLFERYKGRLQNLTPAGERFYANTQSLLHEYEVMMDELREDSVQFKGKIRIGIPPLVLGIVFADVIAQLLMDNPDIKVEIVEQGAYELRRMLILQELDFAILLQPTNINADLITEYVLQDNELIAFMNNENPLASKEMLTWQDLQHQPLSIFNDTFMIHHKIIKKLEEEKIQASRLITASSWDFLLLSTRNSDLITILPGPIAPVINHNGIVCRSFHNPITWKVVLCHPKKERRSYIDKHVLNYILDYFNKQTISV